MNTETLLKIKEIVDVDYYNPEVPRGTVSFLYDCDWVICTIQPFYHKSVGYQKLGKDIDDALWNTKLLQSECTFLKDIEVPDLKEQTNVGGYYRKALKEPKPPFGFNYYYELEFKRTHDSYVVTNLNVKENMKDKHQFYVHVNPLHVNIFVCPLKTPRSEWLMEFKNCLNEGEHLLEWDDIGALCGSAGVVIVKNDRVIKSKLLERS